MVITETSHIESIKMYKLRYNRNPKVKTLNDIHKIFNELNKMYNEILIEILSIYDNTIKTFDKDNKSTYLIFVNNNGVKRKLNINRTERGFSSSKDDFTTSDLSKMRDDLIDDLIDGDERLKLGNKVMDLRKREDSLLNRSNIYFKYLNEIIDVKLKSYFEGKSSPYIFEISIDNDIYYIKKEYDKYGKYYKYAIQTSKILDTIKL